MNAAPGRRRGQFGLRTLVVWLVLIAALLAVHRAWGWAGSMSLSWIAVLVAAHVAANAWGTRVPAALDPREGEADAERAAGQAPTQFAPTTRLGSRAHFGRGLIAVCVIMAAAGAMVAATALIVTGWSRSVTGVGFASVSGAVLGAWAGFLGMTFIDVGGRAWREAVRASRDDTPRPPSQGKRSPSQDGAPRSAGDRLFD